MRKRVSPGVVVTPAILLGLVCVLFTSCSDDDDIVAPPSKYKDLTLRDHVLFNLEKSYNERNLERYDELLDADFVFVFSEADVANGLVTFKEWNRAREIAATRNFFDPTFSKPGFDPVSDVDLTLAYVKGEAEWEEIEPADPVEYPLEKWYKKTVTYSLTVKSGDRTFAGHNIQATFALRRAKDMVGKEFWRIVVWQDDTGFTRATDLDGKARSPSGTYVTWGQVKSLYSS